MGLTARCKPCEEVMQNTEGRTYTNFVCVRSARRKKKIMAIYHLSVQIIGRGRGRSAIAAAAYRSGEKLRDHQTGELRDYTRKDRVHHTEIMAPETAPAWITDREKLWNEVERAERRMNSQIAREVNIALPVELDRDQQTELIRGYVRSEFVERGMVADLALHDLDGTNPHAHIMLSTREIGPEGWGGKNREWNDKTLLQAQREAWERVANRALERAGRGERINHRSLKAQGVDRAPGVHVGPLAAEMERRGERTERGDLNRSRAAMNAVSAELEIERENLVIDVAGVKTVRDADQALMVVAAQRGAAERGIREVAAAIGDHNERARNAGILTRINPLAVARGNREASELEQRGVASRAAMNAVRERERGLRQARAILWEREAPDRERAEREEERRREDFARTSAVRAERDRVSAALTDAVRENPDLWSVGMQMDRVRPLREAALAEADPERRERVLQAALEELRREASEAQERGRGHGLGR